MFTMYYAPDTCALATLIAFKDAGLAAGVDYTLRRVDFSRQEQRAPEYLKVNPKGRVPALVTPRGILTETPAMLAFVAQSFPGAGLAPLDDPFAFAELQAFNSFICSSLHVAHAHRMRGHRWVDENDAAAIKAMQDKVPDSVGACYDLIETGMFKGPWVMGAAYTVADPYLFTLAQWLEQDGVDPARIPKVMDHRARMAARANVKAAIAEEYT
ncbi:glutathione S-transferase family protein [Thalassospiraceae bacterium LMO-SO8]|nr:glutathione S-transferase family protein [Alphaproteobacteria bacterium LMO-S08]WND76819.1 glutathione S-transferase family protein [Thalassospiraceae bacterium LMO-SO8]